MLAPAVTNSAAARSATMRSSPTASVSVRCTRSKPRFQFGSHCAVTVAIAARIAPIRAVASSASTSVKPAMRAARARVIGAGFRRRRTVLICRIWPGGRLHAHHDGLRHPGRLRPDRRSRRGTAARRRASDGRRLRRRNCRARSCVAVRQPGDDRARGLDQRQMQRRPSARRAIVTAISEPIAASETGDDRRARPAPRSG